MKRHDALVPLSHDHHHALVAARRLRRAAGLDREEARHEAASAFLAFFERETRTHFREEEERFLPLLPEGDEGRARVLLEHLRLGELAARLAEEPSPAVMEELGDGLERHIRFEERELFPILEEILRGGATPR